jgi:hypothetical protein
MRAQPPVRRNNAVRLSREATVGIVLIVMLAFGALGIVASAAVPRSLAASAPEFPEARLLPLVARQVPARQGEPQPSPAGHDISLGGSPPAADGSSIVLMDGAVAVPLPDGWSAPAGDGQRWTLLTRAPLWGWVQADTTDVTVVDSEDLLRASFEHGFVADARVGDVLASDVEPLPPFGRVASRSMLSYRGVYADPMFPSRFQSNLYAGIRSDGTVLLVEVRLYSGSRWDDHVATWYPALYVPLWESFGQAALPSAAQP